MSLKKFEVREMIAKGGMAEVYRAHTVGPEGFAKEVCVKKILPHLTEDPSFVKMFIDEAKLAATLNFANIVQVHDLCVSASHEYFIVMEYVEGKDLSDVIRGAQLAGREVPADIAVYVAREVAKGLYYAHTRTDATGAPLNLIHRDISPQNVLISYMGEVKITDFGIAKASSTMSKTAVGILKGKYGYMSPEQARGERIDARSDIFCLGIVLYELLVGERCFAGASDYSTLNLMREAVVTPPTKINDKVPKALEAMILKALSKEPDDRYRDALELEGALAKWADDAKQDARSTDLARFMVELFPRDGLQSSAPSSTGVLDLASVVGPAATPDGASEPGQEALARLAKRVKSEELGRGEDKQPEPRKSEPPPKADKPRKSEAPPPKADKPRKSEPPPKVDKPRKSEAPPPKAQEEPEAPPKEAKVKSVAPPLAEPGAEAPPAEGKPRRLKPDASDKNEAKKKAAENKRPIGRRDLKPGATAIQDVKQRGRSFGIAKAAVVAAVAALAGGAAANMSRQAAAQEGVLRNVELEGATKENAVPVVLENIVPGSTLKLDGKELPATQELLVAGGGAHELELLLDGKSLAKKSFEISKTGRTSVHFDVPPPAAKLAIDSIPSAQPVRIDGRHAGQTPLEAAVFSGSRIIAIGEPGTEKRVVVEAKDGVKVEVREVVPFAKGAASFSIEADPRLEVRLDGRPSGRRADGTMIPADAGRAFKVTLVTPEGKAAGRLQVKLEPGERRTIVLEPEEPKKPAKP
ncbi:MAG: protein kinase [Deltaproteobacteria bacterium]|nr:protein kinase [Deltaproteobacteria bacterium]